MISLQKYISTVSEPNITINNELEQHFYCEFVLQESFRFSYFNILEKYGSYIGQKELIIDLSKEIYLTIKNKEPEDEFKLNKSDLEQYYDTLFFNELIIKFDNNDTAYVANKSHYDEKTKTFDVVFIKFCPDEYNTYTSITSALMHEILHAYNHYQSYFNAINHHNKSSALIPHIQKGHPLQGSQIIMILQYLHYFLSHSSLVTHNIK